METAATFKSTSKVSSNSGKLLLALLLFAALTLAIPVYYSHTMPSENQRRMEKSTGRNGKHANPKARESAEQEYQRVKEQFQEWDKKPNKTPEEKEFIKKLRKMLEKLRKKKDFSGENHSQKHKGF